MRVNVDKEALRLHVNRCVGDLPALPDVVARVLELTDSKTSTAGDLERVISTDQALAGKILRVVNSAFYGAAGKVSTISHAVMVLGVKQLRNLTLSVAAMSLVKARMPHMAEHQMEFWRHSLGTGAGAAAVARKLDLGRDVADEAFTGGLLHDLGRLFLLGYFFTFFSETALLAAQEDITVDEAERELLGLDHAEIGVMLGNHWHFPEPLLAIIERHHGPLGDDEYFPLCACVHIGDNLASTTVSYELSERSRILPEALEWAKLTPEDLAEVSDQILEKVRDSEEFVKTLRAA
ncbi:MAG: hypothetical protein AMXMBFR61_18720 [Fimbriimonadales bacterium]